jgi:branched-chain amino acid transport system substrate-binding protein
MKGKLVSVMLVVLALSLVITACAPSPTPTPSVITKVETKVVVITPTAPPPAKPIKVGLPVILTGADTYVFGEMVRDAATMAVEEINATGGVLGRPLELVVLDDAGDAAQAVAVAHKLCEDQEIVAVIGHTFSGTTIPTEPIYNECKLAELELGSNPRTTLQGFDNVFRTTCANDLITGYAGADYVVEKKAIKSVAVIHNKTMWGQAVATVFQKRCEALGVKVTSFQGVDQNAVDFTPTLTKVKGENPEAVYFAGYSESALVCNQMRDLGMKQLYIAAEATSSEFVDAVKERGIGALAPTAAPPIDFRPETRKFTAAFKARWGKDPEEWSPVYYDVVYALAAAIKQAGTTDRAAIVKALHEIEVPSIVQPEGLGWDEYGEQRHPVAFIWELQPDLQMRVVYTWQGKAPYQTMSYADYKALVVSLLGL